MKSKRIVLSNNPQQGRYYPISKKNIALTTLCYATLYNILECMQVPGMYQKLPKNLPFKRTRNLRLDQSLVSKSNDKPSRELTYPTWEMENHRLKSALVADMFPGGY